MPAGADTRSLSRRESRLRPHLGPDAVRAGVPLAGYTTLRIGGEADLLVVAQSLDILRKVVLLAWDEGVTCHVLGHGSNVLVSDAGVRGLVVINRARSIGFEKGCVRAESGASLAVVARESVALGLAGMEWALGIPGTVGGAVVGNAGAWGGGVAGSLTCARLLLPGGAEEDWLPGRFEFGYRTSVLKHATCGEAQPLVLSAEFALQTAEADALQARVASISARRRTSQPSGASCGSVFRNPPGDYAGRLIEQAGLKGSRSGGAEISSVHANFFVNLGGATASDVKALIDLARVSVRERFGVGLQLEIQMCGDWEQPATAPSNRLPATSNQISDACDSKSETGPEEQDGRSGRKVRVALLFGGRSGEHEVSVVSAQGVLSALDAAKYDVVLVAINKEGRWLALADPTTPLSLGNGRQSQPAVLLAEPGQTALMRLDEAETGQALAAVGINQVDVVLPILHGPYGEDGTVQGLLELADLPYVGAGVAASAVGMDKVLFKGLMRDRGLPVVRDLVILRKAWETSPQEIVSRIEAEIGYDCFVKPACLGSSVGVSKAHNRAELYAAVDEAARYDRKIIVEVAVDAREIEVAVLGNDEPAASVPGEIVPGNEFYDYAAKYLDGNSELLIPAPIPPQLASQARQMAVEAFRAIDCAGMARVDFLLDRGSGRLFINEVNTIPGFTPISMYPKLWEASGLPYRDLIDRLIELACERHQDRARSATNYEAPKGT